MKKLILAILLISTFANAQNNTKELTKHIQETTTKIETLFLNQKFEKLSDFASPKLIEFLTSKQDLVYLFSELTKTAESKGIKVTDISFGKNSKIYKEGNELQCVIPFTLKLENEKKIVLFNAGLALISLNKGENWYFTFRINQDNLKNNNTLGLNKNIVIPQKTQQIIAK